MRNTAALLAGLLLMLVWPAPGWSASPERDAQKRNAEAEHAQLHQKLSELKQDIIKTESATQLAQDELAESESAISNANRRLHDLEQEQKDTEQKLEELTQKQEKLTQQVRQQQKNFSTLLRQQYQTGSTDRIKLLLSGDNPNRINRELQYLGYLSQSQNQLITDLRTNLDAVEQNKLATLQTKTDLDDISKEQSQERANLVTEQAKRSRLLHNLSSKLSEQRKQAGQLQKNESRLASLVERLNQLIESQRKADALRQQKARADKLIQEENARRQAMANKTRTKDIPAVSVTTTARIIKPAPVPVPVQVTETPEPDTDTGQFAQLRGRLRLPVKGELTAKFGSQRGEGTTWKGIFIRAGEGTAIKAIAPGKVIFSEWLRGFGNLIILDHGNQYMSIYGNNQAVLKQAGDQVKAGDQIASAGNSGGNEQSGLYFELRHQGRAFDPLSWISIK